MREETDAAIEAADRKHLQLRNDAHEALSRVSALEAQLASEKRAAADAEATAKNELQQARALIESLQRRLTTAEELETKSSSDLAAQRQQAARTGAVTEMKLRSMERQLKDARSEASQAQSRVDELETEHAAYRKTAQQRELDLQVCRCSYRCYCNLRLMRGLHGCGCGCVLLWDPTHDRSNYAMPNQR